MGGNENSTQFFHPVNDILRVDKPDYADMLVNRSHPHPEPPIRLEGSPHAYLHLLLSLSRPCSNYCAAHVNLQPYMVLDSESRHNSLCAVKLGYRYFLNYLRRV